MCCPYVFMPSLAYYYIHTKTKQVQKTNQDKKNQEKQDANQRMCTVHAQGSQKTKLLLKENNQSYF